MQYSRFKSEDRESFLLQDNSSSVCYLEACGSACRSYGSASVWLLLWMLNERISVVRLLPNESTKYFCNFLLIMWTLLGEDIFLHLQILQKILVKYLDSSFQISNNYWLHCKHGNTKSFLSCISKTYTYRCWDCSSTRKTMAFTYAWRLVTFKKFQTSPK